jgi:uncharacterized protein (DUF1810 family)
MNDPYDLERFVVAQDAEGTYERAVAELQRGTKTSHWMWFVFPQIAGLGTSPMSRRFAISSLDEATAGCLRRGGSAYAGAAAARSSRCRVAHPGPRST